MKRRLYALIPLVLLFIPLTMSSMVVNVQAQVEPVFDIAASVSSLAGISQEVGGSLVRMSTLLDQEADPHTYAFTPEVIAMAEAADLLVFTGHFHWEEELANLTATPFISFHDDNALEMYEEYGASLSPMPGEEETIVDGGHDHEGNPHAFWLLPQNALAIANATRAALTSLNATFAGDWSANFNSFSDSIDGLQTTIDTLNLIHGFSDMHAVVVSPAEAYVAEAFGITCDAVLQIEDITLPVAKLLEVQEAIRNGSISLIIGSDISQFQAGGDFAYQIQTDYGGILIWWRTVFFAESEYFWLMNYNLGALVSGIEGRSGTTSNNSFNVGLLALSAVLGIFVTIESVLLVMRARAE
ncbi:MAG: metal ABC transporter substrate-binding protein [Candidatus Thorarchaeota archaeon]